MKCCAWPGSCAQKNVSIANHSRTGDAEIHERFLQQPDRAIEIGNRLPLVFDRVGKLRRGRHMHEHGQVMQTVDRAAARQVLQALGNLVLVLFRHALTVIDRNASALLPHVVLSADPVGKENDCVMMYSTGCLRNSSSIRDGVRAGHSAMLSMAPARVPLRF